jgi:hypothetical protein
MTKFILFLILYLFSQGFIHFLKIEFNISVIVFVAGLGFLGSFISIHKKIDKHDIHGIIYSGAFAGMANSIVFNSFSMILLSASIATSLYLLCNKLFLGIGGKLGTLAFLSTCLTIIISHNL